MNFEKKVQKAIQENDYAGDWEVQSRDYGYVIKLYDALPTEASGIAWNLQQILGYGELVLISRKKYECIKCNL